MEWNLFSKEQIESLKRKAIGGKRLVIAYFSIGEAEDYRNYWKKSGIEKTSLDFRRKSELERKLSCEILVLGMEENLKRISKKLDEIGVDGYLLDTVDSFIILKKIKESFYFKVVLDYWKLGYFGKNSGMKIMVLEDIFHQHHCFSKLRRDIL